jgi:hypothetical protein
MSEERVIELVGFALAVVFGVYLLVTVMIELVSPLIKKG